MDHLINDIRLQPDFRGQTFSNFKKTDVKKELLNNLKNEKIEPSCYWSAEMICSGHYIDLWDILIYFYTKYIHLGNPKIAIYLEMRINSFKNIMHTGYSTNELQLRNNPKIRRLFCEIICVLCLAKRRHGFEYITIKDDDFDMIKMREKMKATKLIYGETIFKEEDPKELFISINEMAYSVSRDGQNIINSCYWMEWILEFDRRSKKRKERLECDRRNKMPVDSKYQKEIVWMLWDIFLFESALRGAIMDKVIKSLLSIFCLKYSNSTIKKRKYIMYFVITLLCENPTITEEILTEKNKKIVLTVSSKIDNIYKQIKKGEEMAGTEYLFKDSKAKNLQNTISKIEQLTSFETTFIPRIE